MFLKNKTFKILKRRSWLNNMRKRWNWWVWEIYSEEKFWVWRTGKSKKTRNLRVGSWVNESRESCCWRSKLFEINNQTLRRRDGERKT